MLYALFPRTPVADMFTAAGSGSPTCPRFSRRWSGHYSTCCKSRSGDGARRGRTDTGSTPPIMWRISIVRHRRGPCVTGLQAQLPAAGRHLRREHDARRGGCHARFHACEREYRLPAAGFIPSRAKNPFHAAPDMVLCATRHRADERGGGSTDGIRRFTSFAKLNSTRPISAACGRPCGPSTNAARCFTIRADRFCAIWSGRSSARWSTWDAVAMRPRSSVRSSRAATCRVRAREPRHRIVS